MMKTGTDFTFVREFVVQYRSVQRYMSGRPFLTNEFPETSGISTACRLMACSLMSENSEPVIETVGELLGRAAPFAQPPPPRMPLSESCTFPSANFRSEVPYAKIPSVA